MNRLETVNRIAETMREIAPTAQTILYGSTARGDANANSDIDLLVILDGDGVTMERQSDIVANLYPLEVESGIIINSIITTRKKWENRPFQTPFYINIMNEGITL